MDTYIRFQFFITVTILCIPVVKCSTRDDTHPAGSPYRRFIYDSFHRFTGWASWEQYAACSTRCVSGHENETEQCCATGDNRICYNLPWEKLKPYVGTCPNKTSTTTVVTTRERQTLTTPRPTAASTPKAATSATKPSTTIRYTQPHSYTIPPVTKTCAVCTGPTFLCEQLYAQKQCSYPNNYCINKISNHRDGTRSVERRCGNVDTCHRKWFIESSDIDLCWRFDENSFMSLDFECTFCCTQDNCNVPLRPADNTLYKDI